MKKLSVLILMLGLLPGMSPSILAQPHRGGEISWSCTHQGNFKFTIVLYRDCYGVNVGNNITMTTTAPGFPSITMSNVSEEDISPLCSCPGGVPILCSTASSMHTGAVKKLTFTSDASYPNGVHLTGVPPAAGYVFSYTSCCRAGSTNVPNGNSYSYLLKAVMYPYSNTPVNPCFDTSPAFHEGPASVLCTGVPVTLNYNASDRDLDSLVYSWAPLLEMNGNPVPAYGIGYSFSTPLPDPGLNPPGNVAAHFVPGTGIIHATSFLAGIFDLVVCVTAYKAGIKVSETYREFEIVFRPCSTNAPPVFALPFANSAGGYPTFSDTVTVGDLVNILISVTDFDYCNEVTPITPQTMFLEAQGFFFGSPINPSGCINPPCASLNPSPTPGNPISGQFGVQSYMNWQTECNHLKTNCGNNCKTNVYHFLFKTRDSFCPVPGYNYATLTLVVQDIPAVPPPEPLQLLLLNGGDVELRWTPSKDTLNSFGGYFIYRSVGPQNPFVLIDSVMQISDSGYVHSGAGADLHHLCYYVRVKSGCAKEERETSDTVCGTTMAIPEMIPESNRFLLGDNIPNPTSGQTLIPFSVPGEGEVSLLVTNLAGSTVHTSMHPVHPGANSIALDVSRLPFGVYLYSIQYQGLRQTKRMTVR